MESGLSDTGTMEGQLSLLYAEKELLEKELGTSDAQEIIAMVKSLEEQLNVLYAEKEGSSDELELRIDGKTLFISGCEQIVVRRKKS